MMKKRSPNAADTEVGESIRAHRLIAGMSQTDLANKLGVSFQQVQKYEKGVNRVGAGRLPQIAEIFNIPIERALQRLCGDFTQQGKGKHGAGQAHYRPERAQIADRLCRYHRPCDTPLPRRVGRTDCQDLEEEVPEVAD